MEKPDFQIRARFRHAIKQAQVADGATVVVAVSGGCDSVSLLHLCLAESGQRNWRLIVAHIDHSLRAGSEGDAAWVADSARGLGLPFHSLKVSPSHWQRLRGESIEAEARRLRRRGLRRIARSAGAAWIFLAHTRDDQAETVLLNLLRGSSARGLAGMSPCRPPWVRPLLQIPRPALRGFAQRQSLAWREDPSNADPRFARNRIRARLLPLLESDFRPGAAKVLARTGELLRTLRGLLEAAVSPAWEASCLEESPGRIRLDRSRLAEYHQAIVEEILRRSFRRVSGSARNLKRAHVTTLAHALQSGRSGSFSFPAGIWADLSRQELCLVHPTTKRDI